jgi:hypothetical protein
VGKTLETISTINSAVRTLLALVACGGLGWGGWTVWSTWQAQEIAVRNAETKLAAVEQDFVAAKAEVARQAAEIATQAETIKVREKEIQRLETVLHWLKIDHRLARLDILEQKIAPDGRLTHEVAFVELNPEGHPLGQPRRFTLSGDMIYIDGLVVKFDDRYVESRELDRATALFVFKRIFTDRQNPRDGFPLDEEGRQPLAYEQGGESSELARQIWHDFWTISNSEEKARDLGIRAAHGLAVSIKPEAGMSYRLELRAGGDITIRDTKPLDAS